MNSLPSSVERNNAQIWTVPFQHRKTHANGNVQARRRRQSISEDPASYIWTDLSPMQLLQWLGSVRRRSTDFRLAKYSNCIRTSWSPNRGWIHGLRWPS
ncbi:unnamed protein product [Nesidiocoris tenuis]|uniref:Uncharacterized protein n=1 Tax=Nesidiocoris tenuis TaxID=355587 RepID=A0A6H5G308_9HEMI|nr:unnamed protein product [Nesidiocoris tenuis]